MIPVVRASEVKTYVDVFSRAGYAADPLARPDFLPASAPGLQFHAAATAYATLSGKRTLGVYYIRFAVYNDLPDTAQLQIYTGAQENLQAREENKSGYTQLAAVKYEGGFMTLAQAVKLSIAPGQTKSYAVRIVPVKRRQVNLFAVLQNQSQLGRWYYLNYQEQSAEHIMFVVFCGMLTMMLIYITLKFVQIRSMEYAYYAGYVLCFLFYFLILTEFLQTVSINQTPWVVYYAVNISQVLAYCCYFPFFRKFLNIEKTLPRLNIVMRGFTWLMLAYCLIDGVLFFFPSTYLLRWMLWDGIRIGLVVFSVGVLVAVARLSTPFMRYIMSGSLAIVVFGLAAMVFSYWPEFIEHLPVPFTFPLFYFQLGITIELLCFALGLGYKNHLDQIEKIQATEALAYERERQEFERYKAAVEAREAERHRIATEMHDDIGSGLASVYYLSGAMRNAKPENWTATADKIGQTIGNLMDQINNIVWSMNKEYDTLPDLVAYIRSNVGELLENAGLDYAFDVPEDLPDLPIEGQQRRNIYLIVKESANNAIKHAHAGRVTVAFGYRQYLAVTISDDGRGIDVTNSKGFGNGLRNMRQRAANAGGTIAFDSEPGRGTSVCLSVPLIPPDSPQRKPQVNGEITETNSKKTENKAAVSR